MSLRISTGVLLAATVLTLGGAALAKPTPCKSSGSCFAETNKGSGAAIEGVSLEPKQGAYGQAAILAHSKGIGGMYSFSQLSYGGELESDGKGFALIAATDNTSGTAFIAEGGSTTILAEDDVGSGQDGYFFQGRNSGILESYLDLEGNGGFVGTLYAAKFITQLHEGNAVRGAFAPTGTRESLEDTGTARLTSGRGIVRFDPAFAGAIDATAGYQVFLTPGGETRGWLFVAQKFAGGFVVREALGGRSSTTFDYRVVARPLGASGARLPEIHVPNERKSR